MQKRLHKFLSEQGICSRRVAEEYISEGKILVNGVLAKIGTVVSGDEEILINGKKISRAPLFKTLVIAFYKPHGVECTMAKIPGTKTLADFPFVGKKVFPIGRLDKDSQGLFLLTNDGILANKIMHPRYEHEKEYLVSVREIVTPALLKKFSSGLIVDGYKTQPCLAEKIDTHVFRVVLKEGRNRQIRKMAELCGLTVVDLLRVRIQRIWLGEMKPGKWRVLSDPEIKGLF